MMMVAGITLKVAGEMALREGFASGRVYTSARRYAVERASAYSFQSEPSWARIQLIFARGRAFARAYASCTSSRFVDLAGLALPVRALPARGPLRQRVHHEHAVAEDERFLGEVDEAQALDHRGELHAVVRRLGSGRSAQRGSRRLRTWTAPHPPGPGLPRHEPSVNTPVCGPPSKSSSTWRVVRLTGRVPPPGRRGAPRR